MLASNDDAVLPDRPHLEVAPSADIAAPNMSSRRLLPSGVGLALRRSAKHGCKHTQSDNRLFHKAHYTTHGTHR